MQALLLSVALLVTFASVSLTLLNLRQLGRPLPPLPTALAAVVEAETWQKATNYARDRTRVGLVSLLLGRAVTLAFLFAGVGAAYDQWVSSHIHGFVASGVVFLLGIAAALFVLSIPVSLYSHFVVEARYGFNRMTFALWCSDRIKGALVSALLLSGLSALGLWLVESSPELWWLFGWAALAVLSVVMSIAWPHVIEPLFFKVVPLKDPELEPQIRELAERARVHVSRVFQMDASRRSTHSNAYFSGLGPEKRVVLFDTLLARMTPGEILAVLAHELGHYRRHHVLKRFVVSQLLSLLAFYLGYLCLSRLDASAWVSAEHGSFAFRAVIVAFAFSLVEFAATPLFSSWSRKHEREADAFASELTRDPSALASGLAKLSRDNLSNLNPHPWYAAFYASHPPARERIAALTG